MSKITKQFAKARDDAARAYEKKIGRPLTEGELKLQRIMDETFPPDSHLVTPEVIRERLRNRK